MPSFQSSKCTYGRALMARSNCARRTCSWSLHGNCLWARLEPILCALLAECSKLSATVKIGRSHLQIPRQVFMAGKKKSEVMQWSRFQANGLSALSLLITYGTCTRLKSHAWFIVPLKKQMAKMASIILQYIHHSHHNDNKRIELNKQSKKLTKTNKQNWAIMRIKLLANLSQLALGVGHYGRPQWGGGRGKPNTDKREGLCTMWMSASKLGT